MVKTKVIIATLLAVSLLAFGCTSRAQNDFIEGLNYVPVKPAHPTQVKPGQIEVIEFFWYGCPHCFAVEPYLEVWRHTKPANVVLKLIPAAWTGGEHMDVDGRAYYTALALGLEPKIHEPLFNAIHLDGQYGLITSQAALQDFFAKYGVSAQQFNATWNSPKVNQEMQQALQTITGYGVMGVPTFVVNGKWLTGGGYGDMTPARIVTCLKFLVQKEEAALKQ
ncbi:MAG: thiol:disulfide interchange protein DsbA/DsbL [Gammaproteobacteria bacterium]